MYFVFYRTTDVFSAEEKMNERKIKTEIVPTPVTDIAYCGVCVKIEERNATIAKDAISGMDYIVV